MTSVRASLLDALPKEAKMCNHKPRPGSGAYGHWHCQRRRLHLGRHRFNNYTWRRGARQWALIRYVLAVAKLRFQGAPPWRRAVVHTTTRYDPVPVK